VQAIIDAARAADPSLAATVRKSLVRDSFEIDAVAPIVTIVREQVAALLGHAPDLIGKTFWMDSALLAAAGIPTVIFGPGGEGAHAVVEWVDVAQVAQCAEIYAATARAFCSDSSGLL
jgi:acetylornithine deacetylase